MIIPVNLALPFASIVTPVPTAIDPPAPTTIFPNVPTPTAETPAPT